VYDIFASLDNISNLATVIHLVFTCSYESRPNGGFSVFYTLPENTGSKPEKGSSDRLAKLIREVNKNVLAQSQSTKDSYSDAEEASEDDESESYEDKAMETEAKPMKDVKVKAKKTKKKKEEDGKYREDYYEDGSYNEDYYQYENTDPTHLDQPPDKSGLQPCFFLDEKFFTSTISFFEGPCIHFYLGMIQNLVML